MEVKISLTTVEGYRTIYSDSVSVTVENASDFREVRRALLAAKEIADDQCLLNMHDDRVVEVMLAKKINETKAEAIKEAKADLPITKSTYALEAEVNELKRELKQKSCQLDGLIMKVNPNFVPNPDGLEPQSL